MPAEKIHWFGATHAAGCPPVAVRMMVPSGARHRPSIVTFGRGSFGLKRDAGRDHEAADDLPSCRACSARRR